MPEGGSIEDAVAAIGCCDVVEAGAKEEAVTTITSCEVPDVDATEEGGTAVRANVAVQSPVPAIHVAGGMAAEYGRVIVLLGKIFDKSKFGLYCFRFSKDCRPICLAILSLVSLGSTIRIPFTGVGQEDWLDDAGTPRTSGKNWNQTKDVALCIVV